MRVTKMFDGNVQIILTDNEAVEIAGDNVLEHPDAGAVIGRLQNELREICEDDLLNDDDDDDDDGFEAEHDEADAPDDEDD